MITAAMAEALEAGLPRALLAKIDHPDGTVWLWSRTGTLDYDGQQWIGIGALGRITPLSSSLELAIQQVAFELRGVPETALAFLSNVVRGRIATLWLACIKKKRRVVLDPILLGEAELDYQVLRVEDNLTATIQLVGNMGFFMLERAQNIAWTREEQNRRFPAPLSGSDILDTGFDLIPSAAVKEIEWTLS